MPDLAKVPVTIVTGFLGAGKTTLISHLIRHAGGRRLAVVVNEFGTLGVDGDILKSCAIPDCPADNIVELANGCICCTVADDFIPTVERLLALDPRPDHILIETSGLACPSRCSRRSTGPRSAAASPWTACWRWPMPKPWRRAASPRSRRAGGAARGRSGHRPRNPAGRSV
jgi:hypothetical protein